MQNCEWYKQRIADLKAAEAQKASGVDSALRYQQAHQKRFEYLLSYANRFCPDRHAAVLDFGRSGLTEVLNSYYSDLTTIGFPLESDDGGHRELTPLDHIPHIICDLTTAEEVDNWPQNERKFDLIVFCEVVEHVPVAPEFQILLLSSLLKPGGQLLLSTPNGVNWYNRLKMAIGRNPFERIRFNLNNPGHFREYTEKDIQSWAPATGLTLVDVELKNFDPPFPNTLLALPRHWRNLRETIIALYQKPTT